MDPRNPVFAMASLDPNGSAAQSERDHGYLTPPSPGTIESVTFGINPSGLDEPKPSHSMDPDIFIQFPVSTMSPMPSDDGGSPKWDWDNELNAL